MIVRFVSFAVLLIITSGVQGKELSIDLHASSRDIRIGDHPVFTITYKNESKREIAIMPEYRVYAASEIDCVRVSDGKRAQRIPLGQAVLDFEGFKKSFRVLRPGEIYSRHIRGTFSNRLPSVYGRRESAPYLVLGGSAIRLPGFGTYKITTDYSGMAEDRSLAGPGKGSKLWLGKVQSTPIAIEFRKEI
jgi:hypothetical protein